MILQSTDETEPLTAGAVKARVDDWAERIDRLYRDLRSWLPPGYRAETSQDVTMNEEVMREFGLPPIRLPVLAVFDDQGWKAKIIPYGLWVIGADGRLDVLTGSKTLSIIGQPREDGTPGWRIAGVDDRWTLKELDRQSWAEALQ